MYDLDSSRVAVYGVNAGAWQGRVVRTRGNQLVPPLTRRRRLLFRDFTRRGFAVLDSSSCAEYIRYFEVHSNGRLFSLSARRIAIANPA